MQPVALARQAWEACAGRSATARQCLEERHRRLQTGITEEFWQSLGGS